jgi:hypothetical protein
MTTHTDVNEKQNLLIGRVAITPREFAAKFGKSVTWVYRLIYAGEIRVLANFRPRLIPITEIEKFLSKACHYAASSK